MSESDRSPGGVDQISVDDPQPILDHEGIVLLEFWADWCAPCHAMRPELEAIAGDGGGDLWVCAVEITAAPRITQHFGVSSVPTLVVLRSGSEVRRVSGAKRRSQLQRLVDAARS